MDTTTTVEPKWELKITENMLRYNPFVGDFGYVWFDESGAWVSDQGAPDRNNREAFFATMRGNSNGTCELKVGCRKFYDRDEAEHHWKDGRSRDSGYPRPHAKSLIEFVAAEFKKRGYDW